MRFPHAASAAISLFFVILAIGSTDTQESVEKEISATGPSMGATAAELMAAYEANEVAADEKYKDQVILVSGTIENIGKDIMDTMYISLKTESSVWSVQCMFAEDHKSQLVNAAKGQQVNVKGKCEGKLGNVLLRGCSLE